MSLSERLDKIDRETDILFNPQQQQQQFSPKFQEITMILNETPLLVEPCLNWLKQKQADIAGATLNVLYTKEQLEEMRKKID